MRFFFSAQNLCMFTLVQLLVLEGIRLTLKVAQEKETLFTAQGEETPSHCCPSIVQHHPCSKGSIRGYESNILVNTR